MSFENLDFISKNVNNKKLKKYPVHVEDEVELADVLEALVQRLNEHLDLKDEGTTNDFLFVFFKSLFEVELFNIFQLFVFSKLN